MMIFSPVLSLRSLRSAFLALALAIPAAGHAADWNIDQLMRGLAQTRSGHVGFVEKKSIAMLDKPVESSGELFYSAPDHLEKRTVKPKSESMIVDGDELSIDRGRQKYRLQLQDYPELAAFLDSIRGTLAGDRKALERNYQLSLDGSAARWTLQLLPLSAKMQKVVQRIRITGTHDQVDSIEIMQADGDSSVMTITKLAAP